MDGERETERERDGERERWQFVAAGGSWQKLAAAKGHYVFSVLICVFTDIHVH